MGFLDRLRIESDPQENETSVVILSLLGAVEPAQCTMQSQAEIHGLAIPFLAVALFRVACCM